MSMLALHGRGAYAPDRVSAAQDRMGDYEVRLDGHAGCLPAGGVGVAQFASRLYWMRRWRDHALADLGDLFQDPAWDLLLDLFVAYERGQRLSITSACISARVPPTTALRWISLLVDRGVVRRVPDLRDRRRQYLEMSDAFAVRLCDLLDHLAQGPLAVAPRRRSAPA